LGLKIRVRDLGFRVQGSRVQGIPSGKLVAQSIASGTPMSLDTTPTKTGAHLLWFGFRAHGITWEV
jgi:hypothetical protein